MILLREGSSFFLTFLTGGLPLDGEKIGGEIDEKRLPS